MPTEVAPIPVNPNGLLTQLVAKIPGKASQYAKVLIPSATAAIAVVANWISSGSFDGTELKGAGLAAGMALLTLIFPNVKTPV